ncbi:MAG: hypothetical protein JWO30_2851 [Fibrobacteres bacterium]|nr:hypothetical protein [Fibrobacterota bacterium]
METWKHAARVTAILIPLLTAGCSKIYFHNGTAPAAPVPPPEFHHVGILGLVEFSQPENLKTICNDKDWSVVLTEKSFITGLVSAVTQQLYTPWAFSAGCK